MIKAWSDEAWEDFEYWTKQDRKTLKRILQLIKDIDRNGYEGIGKPERLSGDLSAYWSRLTFCRTCNMVTVGVPTVVDAATIVGDALEKLLSGDSEFDRVKYMGQHRSAFVELNNMYMTGKDVDAVIKRVSFTVSEGINMALELGED